jgi:hypothetical protein
MAGLVKLEFSKEVVLITSRTILSRMWFKLTSEPCDFFNTSSLYLVLRLRFNIIRALYLKHFQ